MESWFSPCRRGVIDDAADPALDAVQVIQPISNTNFDVAVKIDSTLVAATKYYGQGLMVEGDAKDYIRFELGAGGTVSLSGGTVIAGVQSGNFSHLAVYVLCGADVSAPDARRYYVHGLLVD